MRLYLARLIPTDRCDLESRTEYGACVQQTPTQAHRSQRRHSSLPIPHSETAGGGRLSIEAAVLGQFSGYFAAFEEREPGDDDTEADECYGLYSLVE